MIYFIKSQSGYVKIGYSDGDITKRLSTIQSNSPLKLDLLKVIPGDLTVEKDIHSQYKKYRVHGEWFKFPRYIIDQIKNNWIDGVQKSPEHDAMISLDVKKVREEMHRQRLTYNSIGKAMHVTRQAVSHYLNHPSTLSLTTINKLAKVLNCDPKDLLI